MIRLGWSITRIGQTHDSSSSLTHSITCDHVDFELPEFADSFENSLRQAHDQESYDVRTWRSYTR